MKKFFAYIKTRPLALASVIILVLLYLAMIFADFVAPYPATLTFEENTFHPANIRLTKNGLVAKEAKTISMINWKYAFVKGAEHKVRFFAKGFPYKLFGLIPCDRHLFGTEASAANGSQGQNAESQNLSQGQNAGGAALTPYPVYLLGADNLGRDMFSRMVYGSRISLTIGFVATAVSMLLAMILGGAAGYYGAKTDWAVMRLAEFFMLVPSLYLILFLRSLLNSKLDSGTAYMIITMILSLVGWPGSARTIRGMVHAIKREDFVQNAALESVPDLAIIFRHIIPQISSLLIVSAALSVPAFIMSETTLSYLGLGIADPAVSWGSMINREISTLSNLSRYPWLLNPVWLLLATTLAFNFLADALRDYYDPYHAVFPTWKRKKRAAAETAGKAGSAADEKSFQDQDAAEQESDASPRSAGQEESFESPRSAAPADALLVVQDLRVGFESLDQKAGLTRAVRGISYYVKRGEILGIVGESGSGKSVSTTAIPGLLPANARVSGKIFFDGTELTALSQKELRPYRGKRIALILQEPGRSFDPLQNIGSVFFELYRNTEPKISRNESDSRAAKILGEVGLPDPQKRLRNYPHQFSGGQLQRIGIALALAQNAELLIADEPTTALDVTIQAQIVSLLLDLKKKRGLSIIFISHNIDLVSQISDRMIVMYGGKIMEQGSAADVSQRPKNPYTQALLSALPKFGTSYTERKLLSIPGSVVDPKNPPPGCPFEPRCSFVKEECKAQNYSCWKEAEAAK
ncbi:MAG: oligopeptide/dipeptide ABC transporter ATP-binding protein [Treponema sp.]|nr:oligopeptide/dipeptide ABC transporter ATP-binding protein [Treponema sp.]MEE3434575.1 oligopeptide/dipeptide ABC transporter ATP-binding protein [Treponema sp.]